MKSKVPTALVIVCIGLVVAFLGVVGWKATQGSSSGPPNPNGQALKVYKPTDMKNGPPGVQPRQVNR